MVCQYKKQLLSHWTLSVLLVVFTGLYYSNTQAALLSDFKARYDVNAFGVDLGQADHQFYCQGTQCTLTSYAKPSGFAALFFSDSATETIQLQQTPEQLTWLSYHKLGTHKKNGKTVQKHTTLQREQDKNQVTLVEKQRTWSNPEHLFDILSLPYAIQYFKLNHHSLDRLKLYIQDSNFQEKLTFQTIDQPDTLTMKFSTRPLNALKYVFDSQQFKMELWLLPQYQYFPAKVRLINKKEDKLITLNLVEPPKFL